MSTENANKRLNSLEELILPIEKDLAEISHLAAQISEKFQNVSTTIKSLSSGIGLLAGKKAGNTTYVVGEVFNFIGYLKASAKEDEALENLLVKKNELASLKSVIVKSYRESINAQLENLLLLLKTEVSRIYDKNDESEFVKLYGESIINAFDLFILTQYSVQICDFMLAEFTAWSQNIQNSDFVAPDKSNVLNYVFIEVIFPKGLNNYSNLNETNAGKWLLQKRENIFAATIYDAFVEGEKIDYSKTKSFYADSYKKTNILKRESYNHLKKYVEEITKISEEDKIGNLKVITESTIYKQAKSVCNIGSSFNYFFIRYFILFLFFTLESAYRNNSSYLSGVFYGLGLAFVFSLVCKFWIWSKNVKSESGGCSESFVKIALTIFSLGTIPLLVKSYENKEISFENFITYLRDDVLK
jgi:hypothetical protein